MKIKVGLIILASIFFLQFLSSSITFEEQPASIYNFGDTISSQIKIEASEKLEDFLSVSLICGDTTFEIYKSFIFLESGQSQEITISVPLKQSILGEINENCKIKAKIDGEKEDTEDFFISTEIELKNIKFSSEKVNPGETLTITGDAIKKNSKEVNGFIEITIIGTNKEKNTLREVLNNSNFKVEIKVPEKIASGNADITILIYEKENEEKTNKGTTTEKITINQIPKNLEVILEENEIETGEKIRLIPNLYDQIGEKISANAKIKVLDSEGITKIETEIETGEKFEYEIEKSEKPSEWKIEISSKELSSTKKIQILETEKVQITILNQTIELTNIGNVLYDKEVKVYIGGEEKTILPSLKIGETKIYLLSAPNGEYDVAVTSGEEESIAKTLTLTGKAIAVKENSTSILNYLKAPISWMFILIVIIAATFIFFKKDYKTTFTKYIQHPLARGNKIEREKMQIKPFMNSSNPAELSLSIKGEKQNASVVCLKIEELEKKDEFTKQLIQKMITKAESIKANIYENADNILFLFVPAKTRTFDNEKPALKLAEEIKQEIDKYNKLYKNPINYGISVNYGEVIVSPEKDKLKFMSTGTFISAAKRISSLSKGNILLTEKFREKVINQVKTEKKLSGETPYYSITEVREEKEENKKFIKSFVEKLEKDKNYKDSK